MPPMPMKNQDSETVNPLYGKSPSPEVYVNVKEYDIVIPLPNGSSKVLQCGDRIDLSDNPSLKNIDGLSRVIGLDAACLARVEAVRQIRTGETPSEYENLVQSMRGQVRPGVKPAGMTDLQYALYQQEREQEATEQAMIEQAIKAAAEVQ